MTPRPPARGRRDQEERPGQETEAAEATGPQDGSPKVSKQSSTGRTQNDERADLAQREKRERGEDGHTSHRELVCPTEPDPSPELSLLHSTPPGPCFLSRPCRDKRDLGSSASGPTGAPCSLPRKPPAAFLLPLAIQVPQQGRECRRAD